MAAPGAVRELKSSADEDDSSDGGPDEPEFAGRSTMPRSRLLSLGVGVWGESEPADLADDRAASTRFLRYEFQ
jgi:hypothetical protein